MEEGIPMALEGNKGIGPRSVAAFAKFWPIATNIILWVITAFPAGASLSILRVISCDDPATTGLPGSWSGGCGITMTGGNGSTPAWSAVARPVRPLEAH